MSAPKKQKKLVRRLYNKYRLVVFNDETFEEKISLRLSPLNLFVLIGTVMLSLIILTIYLVAFTPLREYIPGYADVSMKRRLVSLNLKSDSLVNKLYAQQLYLENFNNVVNGIAGKEVVETSANSVARYDTITHLLKSREDSLLREQIESQDKYNLELGIPKGYTSAISSFYFFTPVKGTITSKFNVNQKHYGIDVVASPNEVIKSTLDGTVVLADWTSETGYVIGVQHSNNLFSLYKHNSALLKSPGDFVKAGEPIAYIGNSGELTTGPHLHFELWYNGNPVNPLDYMPF